MTPSADDWQYMRDWEAEQRGGWGGDTSEATSAARAENVKLRNEVKRLTAEVERLRLLAGEALERRRTFGVTHDQRVEKTVAWMKSVNASQADIDVFVSSQQ
jgi:hypothetical protein